jgi:RNA polymerase sigma factor (sigma-70 family)
MTDNQNWLAEYIQTGSDAAFRELVTRYVDLVYSTALRLVGGDAHKAEDVAQTVFINLARVAQTLPKDVKLGGWLHRDTCFAASTLTRGERRRQSRERQAAEMNALHQSSEPDYSLVAPVLDEAINELDETDRTAILLRFFEQHNFRSVGDALGSNEDAARMRVTRALEKLESYLKRRGITTTAASLGVVLSANAVQAAPVGFALTISTAAVLTGTILATTTTTTAIKTIAMTALQKTIVVATIAVLAGAGIYEARQVSKLRNQVQTLEQQEATLGKRIRQLESEQADGSNRLAAFKEENVRLKSSQNRTELLRLRGEVARFRGDSKELAQLKASASQQDRQSSDTEPQEFLSRNSWAFVGYKTPEATVQSLLWALREGSTNGLSAYLNGFTPETQEELKKAGQKLGFDIFDELGNRATVDTTGFRILKKVVISDEKVLLQVEGEGEQGPAEIFLMKRVGDNWKLSDQF